MAGPDQRHNIHHQRRVNVNIATIIPESRQPLIESQTLSRIRRKWREEHLLDLLHRVIKLHRLQNTQKILNRKSKIPVGGQDQDEAEARALNLEEMIANWARGALPEGVYGKEAQRALIAMLQAGEEAAPGKWLVLRLEVRLRSQLQIHFSNT